MKKLCIFIGLLIVIFGSVELVQAANLLDQVNNQLGFGAKGGELGAPKDPREIIAEFIQVGLTLVGTVLLVLVVISGFWMLTDRGEGDNFEKARKTLAAAVIGLVITLSAYAITLLVGKLAWTTASGEEYDVKKSGGVRVDCNIIQLIKRDCDVSRTQ